LLERLRPIITNICKADAQKDYIGWIISKGYAVIDVNVPKHVTQTPVCQSLQFLKLISRPRLTLHDVQATGKVENVDEHRPTATEELANYLWDNYIE
jgi:histone deacetylase 6